MFLAIKTAIILFKCDDQVFAIQLTGSNPLI